MRKGYLLVCLFFSTTIFSQSINPFNLDYVDWEILSCGWNSSPPPNIYYFTHYKLSGDTVYQAKTYKRIFVGVASWNVPWPGMSPTPPYPQPSSYTFYGFFRQDSLLKRNYLRLPSWNHDSLLMDYNLQIGDTVKSGLYYYQSCPTPNGPLKIIATDSITLGGQKLRILYTDSTGQPYCNLYRDGYFFIEGLGHINGIFEYGVAQEYYCHPFENCPGVDTIRFNVGPLGMNQIKRQEALQISPVPAHDHLELDNVGEGTIFIYNSMGEMVAVKKIQQAREQIDISKLEAGMYFLYFISEGKRSSVKFIKQ